MQKISPEHRISVLLDLLDPDTTERLIRELPAGRSELLRQRMGQLHDEPPTDEEIDDIISEFERLFRLADLTRPPRANTRNQSAATDVDAENPEAEIEDLQAASDDDPFGDLMRMSPLRLAAALRDEAPHTIALLLSRVSTERAAEVMQRLPNEKRYEAFLQMRDTPTAPQVILTRLAQATVAKGLALPAEAIRVDEEDIDTKMARMLRSMERTEQFSILGSFEETDAEAAARIRKMLYVCDDLVHATDRTVQQLLGEVDSQMLALLLKDSGVELREKIFNNLSRRTARPSKKNWTCLVRLPRKKSRWRRIGSCKSCRIWTSAVNWKWKTFNARRHQ